ncbi:hypothetical protein [Pseudokineococcus lusitanus]|uniref:Uncharacterized protein n=1 Tax=Pseudokineococcus lusitanus TaxID=763993 RepID=A0A3N1HTI6_9ACTN|nr:hypothetical protein [Pseudokineococcus lusitanus]ROP45843.1 hypothetical protein EDC03_0453 [Pseudokineococcus lusitanus]
MPSTAVLAAAGEHHVVNELPMDPFFFGLTAFVALLVLLSVTFAFRSVGFRHAGRDGLHDGPHDGPHDAGDRH